MHLFNLHYLAVIINVKKCYPTILIFKMSCCCIMSYHHVSLDWSLNDGEAGQLLSNGEEKLAEGMVKDSEPHKSIGA